MAAGARKLVALAGWVGYLLVLGAWLAAAERAPLCRRPDVSGGCAAIAGNETGCAEWSGCFFESATSRCVNRPGCDQMKCEMANIALRLSGKISPGCVRGDRDLCDEEMDEIFAALELNRCFVNESFRVQTLGSQSHFVKDTIAPDVNTWFVDAVAGDDDKSGETREAAFKTIRRALEVARNVTAIEKTIVLMPGKHRLTSTILLSPLDSNLTFQGETGAVVTGALALRDLAWTRLQDGSHQAQIPSEVLPFLDTLSVLSVDDEPMIRAQWPNKKSHIDFAFSGKSGIERWTPRVIRTQPTKLMRVLINTQVARYRTYVSATGGGCTGVFSPPTGYYCDPRADADINCPFSRVGAVRVRPWVASALRLSSWSDRSTGFFHALHQLKWGGWTFGLSNTQDPTTVQLSLGGFQEARGDCRGGGGEFYFENIRELLDAPKEFFLDIRNGMVYLMPSSNQTGYLNGTQVEVGARISKLFATQGGSATNPVKNLKFVNIKFERTYPTHMEPHEMPSGGDWSLHRAGALFLEGAENIHVADCEFENLGTHGIFLSNYARNVTIDRNSFYGLDATAVMLAGDAKLTHPRPWDRRFDQDHIAGVAIRYNIMRELGLMEIQSAGVFGTIAKDVLVERNIIFNGPRAAVVYNDLFGGNLVTKENIMFNMVRLTLDHGPYNVWDRQQWLLPSGFKTKPNVVERNFFIGTEGGPKVVDMDDGARDHVVFHNVISYGFPKFKGATGNMFNNTVIAYLPSQLSCVYVATSHARTFASTGFVWRDNKCFAPGSALRMLPYTWALGSSRYCSTRKINAFRNEFYGVRTDFLRCGRKLQTWRNLHRQDSGSIFTTPAAPISAAVEACNELMEPFGQSP